VLQEDLPYSFGDLKSCNMTSEELLVLSDLNTEVKPCILYDTMPSIFYSKTTIITIVGVFNSNAGVHRDGALIAVQKLNQDNEGRGAAIGYYRDHYIQFRLVIGVAGNRDQMGPENYFIAHGTMLQVFLEDLKPQYILGTSSFDSEFEREFAGVYQTMLIAQVGPYAYYTSERSNDHVFGAHIPSEGYGIAAFQALRFSNDAAPATQKIRVVFRDRSEFFKSTCQAVVDKAIDEGYNLTKAIEYNPDGDSDGDGMLNHQDMDFLMGLADQACSPDEAFDNIAIWGCFLTDTEVNTFLNRLKANQCRLSSLWLTVASWAWPDLYPLDVPFIQSGGQWHASMQYGDEYFANGQEMLNHMEKEVGYKPDYSALGTYHAIYLMFANVRSFFKGKDEPAVAETFASAKGYEEMRRAMLDLSLPRTLYGPTSFDQNRRNVGRGSAGMQWNLPAENHNHHDTPHQGYELLLVSPVDQATKAVSFPAPAAKNCRTGSFVNVTRIEVDPAILNSKCELCPVDTFSDAANEDTSCRTCAEGASTRGEEGSNICIKLEDNLVPSGLLALGYCIVAVIYSLAIGFAVWTILHRDDPVVRIGQVEFLLMICVGPMISSSSIIIFGIQAGSLEDDTAASRACRALPFLYTTGWILQYGSLSAKTYRMYNIMKAAAAVEGRVVSAIDLYMIILMLLLLNWAIVIPWTIFDPLEWRREEQGTIVDQEAGVMIYESYGRCYADHIGAWVGSTLGLHVATMIVTNYLLYKIRRVSDRYQESKYVAMASAYACEFLLVGIPILVAVGGNAAEANYIVLVCIVGLSDLGILLMIFVPKVSFGP
jgi:7 transmembrane sweet-taste receptor of 3 GCPR